MSQSIESTKAMVALVVTGGHHPDVSLIGALPKPHLVIAADSGLHVANELGLSVDVVIGDFDSVDPVALAAVEALGATVIRAAVDKDATDTELAITYAANAGATHIIVITGGQGRLDHQLGVLAVMFHESLRGRIVETRWSGSRAFALSGGQVHSFDTTLGATIGLVPFAGDAVGVTTAGLKWPLADATLSVTSSRGVSNIAIDTVVEVSVSHGRLIVIDEGVNS